MEKSILGQGHTGESSTCRTTYMEQRYLKQTLFLCEDLLVWGKLCDPPQKEELVYRSVYCALVICIEEAGLVKGYG